MRVLTEEETQAFFEKLTKFLGSNVKFLIDRDDAEYVWHRDNEDREIEILDGEGWQFQIDKCLPWLLKKGMIFDIKKEEYHRLIKGATPLKCRIYKHAKQDS